MSAISGPKMADEPAPISSPWTSANWVIDVVDRGEHEAGRKHREAISAGIQ